MVWSSIISRTFGSDLLKHTLGTPLTLDVGRAAPFASPIRFESLGLLHDPYTLPAGNPIDP